MRYIQRLAKAVKGWGCLIMIAMVVVFLLASVIMWLIHRNDGLQSIQHPEAQYEVVTRSRTYYSNNVTQNPDMTYLYGYYDIYRGKWVYHKGVLPLNPDTYGDIKVIPVTPASTPAKK